MVVDAGDDGVEVVVDTWLDVPVVEAAVLSCVANSEYPPIAADAISATEPITTKTLFFVSICLPIAAGLYLLRLTN